MKESLDSFLLLVPQHESCSPADMIDYFVYFLTVITGQETVKPSEVDACFTSSRLQKYSNISAYLSRNSKKSKGKKSKFIKLKEGYQLERSRQVELQHDLHSGPAKLETSFLLRSLLERMTSKSQQLFLQEAIECYEIGARRAAVVLVWILVIHHLYDHITKNSLTEFNTALSKNTDKRIKITSIEKHDDFSEIPEGKFIELARSAGIISNDVRKILDNKLGTRNTYAHPSGVSISEVKVNDFIIDLVENVILKYSS
ncbi:hypothetical protein [Pseudomonas cichorii]|uniref:hypothetical protein n=1 Tax=Pseudomonas cichorii TaxID=36746 RepID=UPI00046D042E|nr:hypothetical protein [Pseudomonas cichorii]QVE17029.1 hypothetical protein KGD89_24935 [Pseudomonas cichorii]SDO80070.1 hypothetical protein SAMN05216599_11399 [Pseudomonas cichorii]